MIIPENWCMVCINTKDEKYYKIFGEWRGGFTSGDSWRMNSGIESVTEDEQYYYFKGLSGSIYKCYKHAYCIRGLYAIGILYNFIDEANEKFGPNTMTIMDQNEDFSVIDYTGGLK